MTDQKYNADSPEHTDKTNEVLNLFTSDDKKLFIERIRTQDTVSDTDLKMLKLLLSYEKQNPGKNAAAAPMSQLVANEAVARLHAYYFPKRNEEKMSVIYDMMFWRMTASRLIKQIEEQKSLIALIRGEHTRLNEQANRLVANNIESNTKVTNYIDEVYQLKTRLESSEKAAKELLDKVAHNRSEADFEMLQKRVKDALQHVVRLMKTIHTLRPQIEQKNAQIETLEARVQQLEFELEYEKLVNKYEKSKRNNSVDGREQDRTVDWKIQDNTVNSNTTVEKPKDYFQVGLNGVRLATTDELANLLYPKQEYCYTSVNDLIGNMSLTPEPDNSKELSDTVLRLAEIMSKFVSSGYATLELDEDDFDDDFDDEFDDDDDYYEGNDDEDDNIFFIGGDYYDSSNFSSKKDGDDDYNERLRGNI